MPLLSLQEKTELGANLPLPSLLLCTKWGASRRHEKPLNGYGIFRTS